jgi:hypothetical protein
MWRPNTKKIILGTSVVALSVVFLLFQNFTYEGGLAVGSVKPVHRLYLHAIGDHLYTADENEVRVLTSSYGYKEEGSSPFLIFDKNATSLYDMKLVHRLRMNSNHLLTVDEHQVYVLTQPGNGWVEEGVVGKIFSNKQENTFPLYSLSADALNHLLTADENEYNTLTNPPYNWSPERIVGYVYRTSLSYPSQVDTIENTIVTLNVSGGIRPYTWGVNAAKSSGASYAINQGQYIIKKCTSFPCFVVATIDSVGFHAETTINISKATTTSPTGSPIAVPIPTPSGDCCTISPLPPGYSSGLTLSLNTYPPNATHSIEWVGAYDSLRASAIGTQGPYTWVISGVCKKDPSDTNDTDNSFLGLTRWCPGKCTLSVTDGLGNLEQQTFEVQAPVGALCN